MQCRGDRGAIRRESVRGDLERRPRCRVTHAFNEYIRGALVALAHRDVEDQLGVPLDCHEHVAVAEILIVVRADALLLPTDEAPHFVAFDVAHFDVADFIGHDALALLASQHQQLEDRCVVNFGNAFDARYGVAFQQEPQNHLGLLDGQVHPVQRLLRAAPETSWSTGGTDSAGCPCGPDPCAYIRSGSCGRSL